MIADNTGTVTILDTPEVNISDASVQEGGAAELCLTLSGASSITTSVAWATVDGSALAAAGDYGNYIGDSGTATFAAGQTSICFYIQTQVDGTLEGNEDFTVVLSTPSSGLSIDDGTGIVTIIDTPSITIGGATVTEGEVAVIQVCLSHVSASTVSVSWQDSSDSAVSASGDYTSGTGVITWQPGVLCVTISIQTSIDALEEGAEQFMVVLSNPSNAAIAQGTGVVGIHDPDLDRSFDTVTEGGQGQGSKGMGGGEAGSKGMGGGNSYGGNKGMGGGNGFGDAGSKGMGGGNSFGGEKGMGGGNGFSGEKGKVGAMTAASVTTNNHESDSSLSSDLSVAACIFLVAGVGLLAARNKRRRAGYTLARYDQMPPSWYSELSDSPTENTPLTFAVMSPDVGFV